MMSKKVFEIHAEICKTLGNAKRIEILSALQDRELSVSELVDILGIPAANVSQHLSVMRQKGILVSRREGTSVYYKVISSKVNQACNLMREVLVDQIEAGQKLARKLSQIK